MILTMELKPFNYLKYAIVAIVIVGAYSCRKTFNELLPEKIDKKAEWARDYFVNKLQKNEGNQVSYKNIIHKTSAVAQAISRPNMKSPMWIRARADKTNLYEFVEVPLVYTTKISATVGNSGSKGSNKVLKASFDRLVIYKDRTGNIDQRIITYVPTEEYASRHNGDISHNKINHLDKDFDGFLSYKKWDGTPLFVLAIKNGKAVKKMIPRSISTNEQIVTAKGKLMSLSKPGNALSENGGSEGSGGCIDWYWQEWSQVCHYRNPDDTIPWYCDEPILISETYLYSTCPGDPGYNDSKDDFCADPANFGTAICSPPVPSVPDPCKNARTLETNAGYKTLLENLQDGILAGDNFESGYYNQGSSSLYREGYGFLEWDAPQLNDLAPQSMDYMFHNHYEDAQSLSIFSDADIGAFANYVRWGKTTDYNTFIFGLTTSNGTTYALVLEDEAKFAAFYSNYFSSAIGQGIFGSLYGSINGGNYPASQTGIRYTNTPLVNEANFVTLLKTTNSGIALLKANYDLTNWIKVSRDSNGNIVVDNCN